MTTAPNALTDSINHERMPVLLTSESEFETWLSGSAQEAFALASSYDQNAMRIVQSGKTKRTCWTEAPLATFQLAKLRVKPPTALARH